LGVQNSAASRAPKVSDKKWPRTPIDHFILAKLDAEKLKPSPEADKITLLRRLSLDLIGLPPTPEEVDAFLADKSPMLTRNKSNACSRRRTTERKWGRFWLDAARYADSDGFEKDKTRNVWFYRDWVVKAFNAICPTTNSSLDNSPATCWPRPTMPRLKTTSSPLVSSATP
jgi:hypothetical protein